MDLTTLNCDKICYMDKVFKSISLSAILFIIAFSLIGCGRDRSFSVEVLMTTTASEQISGNPALVKDLFTDSEIVSVAILGGVTNDWNFHLRLWLTLENPNRETAERIATALHAHPDVFSAIAVQGAPT